MKPWNRPLSGLRTVLAFVSMPILFVFIGLIMVLAIALNSILDLFSALLGRD